MLLGNLLTHIIFNMSQNSIASGDCRNRCLLAFARKAVLQGRSFLTVQRTTQKKYLGSVRISSSSYSIWGIFTSEMPFNHFLGLFISHHFPSGPSSMSRTQAELLFKLGKTLPRPKSMAQVLSGSLFLSMPVQNALAGVAGNTTRMTRGSNHIRSVMEANSGTQGNLHLVGTPKVSLL